jgi:hypothetical protein
MSLRFAAQINESVTVPNYSAKSCETALSECGDLASHSFAKGYIRLEIVIRLPRPNC